MAGTHASTEGPTPWWTSLAVRVRPGYAAPCAPRLAHVDPRNVGWNYVADAKTSRIVVGPDRVDGAVAWSHYGLAEVDGGPVSADQRAAVLAAVLQEHPGLGAVLRGDLRLRNLWRDYILLEGR